MYMSVVCVRVLADVCARAGARVCVFACLSGSLQYKRSEGLQDYENKLMYFGSVDGVLAMYPGVCGAGWALSNFSKICSLVI